MEKDEVELHTAWRRALSREVDAKFKVIWDEGFDREERLLIIRALCSDPYWGIRDACAPLLEHLGSKSDLYRLRILLEDSAWVVRCTAATSLAALQGEGSLPILDRAWRKEKNSTVRSHIALGLLSIGAKAIPILEIAAKLDKSLSGKSTALYALAMMGLCSAAEELEGMRTLGDRVNQEVIARHLDEIKEKNSATK